MSDDGGRRRNWTISAVAALCLLALITLAIVSARDDDSGESVSASRNVAPGSSNAVESAQTTTTTTAGDGSTTTEVPGTTTSVEMTLPPQTTVPPVPPDEPVCRNSTDPACGPFYYDWPVPNRPAAIVMSASNPMPQVGEQVVFSVTVDDPDGAPDAAASSLEFGDGNKAVSSPSGGDLRYGAWDPPPPLHVVITYEWIYETPGEYLVRFETDDGGACAETCPRAEADLVITVVP